MLQGMERYRQQHFICTTCWTVPPGSAAASFTFKTSPLTAVQREQMFAALVYDASGMTDALRAGAS
jgi:hypothetical protein